MIGKGADSTKIDSCEKVEVEEGEDQQVEAGDF
jgi:hypothetical protein